MDIEDIKKTEIFIRVVEFKCLLDGL